MTKAKPRHEFKMPFKVIDNQLIVGGKPISRLALQVGQTPFYAYDRDLMTQRVTSLRRLFPDTMHLHYAIKANPMPAVVQHMAGLVDGLDVASHREMRVALDAGVPARDISFAGPGKSEHELLGAIAAGILINVESATEVETLGRLSQQYSMKPRVAVRVNPDFELKSSGMKMTGGPKQFGVDSDQVPALLTRIKELKFEFEGFHIFSGSQNLRHESIIEAQQQSLALAGELARHAPGPVKSLNIGGGFGIPYFPGESPLDIQPIGAHFHELSQQCRSQLPQAQLIIELGRYLVGEAGVYVCRVVDRKLSKGQVFLVTDGGLHHHLAASGNFGQVIRKNYPVVIGNKVNSETKESASVVGPLCTPLDLLADRMELSKAEIGDLVVVFQSGAYGKTASPEAFLSHPACIEVLV